MDPINGKIEDWYGAMKVMFDIALFPLFFISLLSLCNIKYFYVFIKINYVMKFVEPISHTKIGRAMRTHFNKSHF